MAFPATPLELLLELFVDGTWSPVPTYNRDPVEVQTGMGERAAVTDPGSLNITINNRDGRYSPRNAESDLYGKIGRNTRCRLSVPGTESYLDLTGGVDTATTPDHAALDITGDLDLRWEGETDWYAPEAQMLIGKWGPIGQRSYHLRLQEGVLRLMASIDGDLAYSAFATLPPLPRRAALRATVDVNNGAGGRVWTFYWAETLDGPWTQIGESVVSSPSFSVFASTTPLTIAPEHPTAVPPRFPVKGRCYRAQVRNGIDGPVVANPDFRNLPGGTTSFTDSAGRDWTMASPTAIRDREDLFLGEISEWPQEWTVDGVDAWVPIEGAGVLRRLGQGRKLLQSSLRRRIPSFRPLAYWPMEDGEFATQAHSPIAGVPPLRLTNANWAAADSLPSSEALPTLNGKAGNLAQMTGIFPNPSFSSLAGWRVDWVYRLDTAPTTHYTVMRILSLGTVREWLIQFSNSSSRIIGRNIDGTDVVNQLIGTGSDLFGQWVQTTFWVTQEGGNVRWNIAWRDVGGDAGSFTATFAGNAGRPTGVTSPGSGFAEALNGMAFGHIAVFDTEATSAFVDAVTAWSGETAWDRMRRLATEEDLLLARHPGPETTALVGPQRVATVLSQLQAAADADGGLLLEDRRRPGLLYRERSSLYNQTPALTLSYDQAPGLAAPLKPVDDDTAIRNDRTVKRDGGSEGRAVLEDGPLSVQDPPDGVGLYDDSVTLSLHSDEQTVPIAYWRLHLGTHDGPRYPRVRVMLHKAPHLIPAVLGLTEGDLLRITDLPRQVGRGHTDLIVTGIHHIAQLTRWEVEFTCMPGEPWRVGTIVSHEDFEDTTYALAISSGGNLPWLRTNIYANTGSWSLRSGVIGNNQTSDAIVAVPPGMETLTFSYRVSSEPAGPGYEGDRFLVLVDGVQVLRVQGTTAVWTRTTIDVAGKARVTFRYAKDNSAAAGEDAAWIDDLTFTGPAPMRVDSGTSTLVSAVTAGATTLSVTGQIPWTTSVVDLPYMIRVGGEEMLVTAVSGATVPQTFTVQRAQNGVSKPHPAGTPVRLADPSVVAL
ncbi:hypothetical protein [Streptomyces sp. ECR3.8]|uniref:hypothetical protein n=1 Tax=Streptomyces sp. ECR3.8 TaxID=3461009 RepID=UPI00404328FD